mgnify:CR=1 FL=1
MAYFCQSKHNLTKKIAAKEAELSSIPINAKSVSEMKVGDITLIKVKNGKIDKYIVDLAKMKKELGIKEK